MNVTKNLSRVWYQGYLMARQQKSMYFTPEHLLYSLLEIESVREAMSECGANIKKLKKDLLQYINQHVEQSSNGEPHESIGLQQLIVYAGEQVKYSSKSIIGIEHIMSAFFDLDESFAAYYMMNQGVSKRKLLMSLCHSEESSGAGVQADPSQSSEDEFLSKEDQEDEKPGGKYIQRFAVNLNAFVKENADPFIGREDLLERTVHVLCRRVKNNPIHIGEPGVGKTAVTLGLAQRINNGNVPEKLKSATIFSVDIGSLLAGTKYRGDFEERMKKVFDEIKSFPNPIVYIDEIHSVVGAGALNGGSLDASNLLKPYLTTGDIRFIGSTTYDEYKKHFEKDKGLARRFQKIEIKETSIEETIEIIEQNKDRYEEFHQVLYTTKAVRAAVELSDKYIHERFLPDKAIDMIDEAGAYLAVHGKAGESRVVDEHLIENVVSKVCHIPKTIVEADEVKALSRIEQELKTKIYGQDSAVEELVRCIKMARAGHNDDDKPIASVLFVGPTGVGKTELAKCLSKQLGIDLVRFDMSEYVEKHTASKLIGTPAGYVGYDDGGLLTDAVRKKPHCVLLLDEIEKAHQDIHNLLLQVMDYATITDNQGRKIDFKNVILIMTSNAGAKNIGKSLVGFSNRTISGEAVHDEVKKVFAPEFRNRLDKIIAFNHIDDTMARQIAEKELSLFRSKLEKRKVKLKFNDECIRYIAEKGISKEFGAREIARIVSQKLKPLLVDEVLFGTLSDGGSCEIYIEEDTFKLRYAKEEKGVLVC